ncbi:dihydrolipoamide S-acetyltransferase [Amniculicola lignicola CBS 123094]|uniref:Acetyltransferase component of pyruvate dehydrogenase complex n=1 Tax=Amniculicola lignicola CBS 123094 TaxID=1392246 RepID=A0A6A5VVK2_9PLEO|nr:dihydrolipoamide S-acetyltransferase [Amniculicola lignicola CBS 123094]
MPATTTLLARAGGQLRQRGSIALRSSLSASKCSQFTARRTPALSALARYYASKSFPSHTVVTMPALSPTMTAGNIGTWQKKVGDTIAPGDVLVEIETDKAQMDFEFQEEGVIAKLLKESGEKDVAVGTPIAVMIEEGEDVAAFESFSIDDAGGEKAPKPASKEGDASSASEPADTGSSTAPPKQESSTPQAIESESTGARLETSIDRQPAASPAVRKLALEKGVALSSIKGSGPGGKITKGDVEKAQSSGATGGAPVGASAGAPAYEDTPATSMRKVIANRLTQSFQQNPHYFVASSISVSKLLKLREALNASSEGAYKLSVNDFLVKALAVAARKVPAANSSWREDAGQIIIRQHNVVDVSVAVATPVGLMTPIVKNVGALGLTSISSQVKDLGKRARDGKLKPEEYQGGTITISNMGMNSAVERFTAVINPPQATIIAVGTTKKVPIQGELLEDGTPSVEWDDQIVITGSFDHKVVDGVVGGEFMKELKKVLENPLELLL